MRALWGRERSQSAHAEYLPSSSPVPELPLVSKVQAQVLKTAARWPSASEHC